MNSLAPGSVFKQRYPEKVGSTLSADLESEFEAAAVQHRPFLLQIAAASTRNPSDAEDVVQEALVRGYRGLAGFRGDCTLRVWLARIVVRVSINHHRSFLRRVKRWSLFSDLERTDSEGQTAPFEPSNRPDKVDPEFLMDVKRQIERLPKEFRIPLLMLAVEGMTVAEIASILEIPEGTVKSRIFYGRKRLRKGLKI